MTTFDSLPADMVRLVGRYVPALVAVNRDCNTALHGEVAHLYEVQLGICGNNAAVIVAACASGRDDILRYVLHKMPPPQPSSSPALRHQAKPSAAQRIANEALRVWGPLYAFDCNRAVANAANVAIIGRHAECVRLILAFARPRTTAQPLVSYRNCRVSSRVPKPHVMDDGSTLNADVAELLAPVGPPLSIDPAIMEVINAEGDIIVERREWVRKHDEQQVLKEAEEYAVEAFGCSWL
jgi:hypothetical protein